jgi:cytochrome c553
MANIFISYSRSDSDSVKNIYGDIKALGYLAWYDSEISGGVEWWNEILNQIRKNDIFIFILSRDSLKSVACSKEYHYALALNKPVIPVQVSEDININLLPPILSQMQIVDYIDQSKASGFRLVKALANATKSIHSLPKPLPELPKMPISYLGAIAEQLTSDKELNQNEQSGILIQLKTMLKDDDIDNVNDTISLLKIFRKRRGLYHEIAVEIAELIDNQSNSKTKEKESFLNKVYLSDTVKTNEDKSKNKISDYIYIIGFGIILILMYTIINMRQTIKPPEEKTSKTSKIEKNIESKDAVVDMTIDGKALYSKCAGCHGADGKTAAFGQSAVIAGQTATDLETKLAAYKAGTLNVAGMGALMKGQIVALTDADIKALARYISGL